MAIFRRECPICAGEFILDDEWPNPTCPYCKMPIEEIYGRDTDIQDLLERAARYRQRRDYSTAKELYQQVRGMAQSKPKFLHAALWGLALCEYGVTYVETEESKQRRSKLFERGLPHDTEASINLCRYPTCCLISEDASAARDYYRAACATAEKAGDLKSVQGYQRDWDYITSIQSGASSLMKNSEPWQIFICFKKSLPQSDAAASEEQLDTIDTEFADKIYKTLTRKGYRVFYSDRTMKSMAGYDYEAVILHALMTASVMLIVCTDVAYLTTPWVQCEWQRYLWRTKREAAFNLRLIPLIGHFGFEELPDELKMKEGFRLAEIEECYKMLEKNLTVACQEQRIPSCQFCNVPLQTEGVQYRTNEFIQCRTCGRYTYLSQEPIQTLQEQAVSFREAHLFEEAEKKYAALEQLNSNFCQAAVGRLLSNLCIAFERDGVGRKPMFCQPPHEESLTLIRDVRRMLQGNNSLEMNVKLCYMKLLEQLEVMVSSYLSAANEPNSCQEIVLLGPAPMEAHVRLSGILRSWGYSVFVAEQEKQGRNAFEWEGRMAQRTFCAKTMLVLCAEAMQLREINCKNEWKRYQNCGEGMLAPVVMDIEASWAGLPEEMRHLQVFRWQGEGDPADAIFHALNNQMPEITACSHARMLIEVYNPRQRRFYRQCVQCGWREAIVRPSAGEAAAREMDECVDCLQKGELVKAYENTRRAAKLAKEYVDQTLDADKTAIQEQLYLMNFMRYRALTGLRIYRTYKGWRAVVGATFQSNECGGAESFQKDRQLLEKHKNTLNQIFGDLMKNVLDESYYQAEFLQQSNYGARRFDICLTLRMEIDGGSEVVSTFARMLAEKLNEERLIIYSPLNGKERSFWAGKGAANHAAVFSSEAMIVLTASREDADSPEVRAQVDRFRRGKPLYLALGESYSGDNMHVKRIDYCDKANAEQLARMLRKQCLRLYSDRIEQLSGELVRNADEIMWYCTRGMELSVGKEKWWFQYRAGLLCLMKKDGVQMADQGVQMIREAAENGSGEAIEFCRKKRLSFRG